MALTLPPEHLPQSGPRNKETEAGGQQWGLETEMKG